MNFTKTKKNWFTLVELIIVITILAILATVAFISFQGFTKDTRDASRLASLNSIEIALVLYYSKTNSYPDVDEGFEIQGSGWTAIGYQGYIGDNVSRLIQAQETPKDPLDNSKYVYSTNASKNKYQLMAFMEGDEYKSLALLGIWQAFADFSARNPKTQWDTLGIILDTNNKPISQNIDIENYTGSALKAILTNDYKIEGTWGILLSLKSSYKNWGMWTMADKNCNILDIVVWSQIWAWCNSTLWNGFEWWETKDWTNASIGSCFPWYSWTNTPWETTCQPWVSQMASNANPKSWFSWKNTNNDEEFNTIWWKLYTWENAKSACPTWRHLPTDAEWTTLENYLAWSICRTWDGWQCSWLWWRRNGGTLNTNLADKLKIPLAGNRNNNGSTFNNRGRLAYLWSNSESEGSAFYKNMNRFNDTTFRNILPKAYGFSVRCLKD